MLRSLLIQDFALINRTEIHFEKGLNIITGETGAGKSILIGALNMVLGERAQTHVVRKGKTKAIAEAEFDLCSNLNQKIEDLVKEHEIFSENGKWLLRREIKESGSRAFINDTPIPIQLLKKVGDLLVDLHGQHDHQLLLKPEYHHLVIDQHTEVANTLEKYQSVYENWLENRNQLKEAQKKQAELEQKIQLYEFQWKELDDAKLYAEEEEELLQEMKKLDSAEESSEMTKQAYAILDEDEHGILALCRKLDQLVQQLSEIDSAFEDYLSEIQTSKIGLGETAAFLEKYVDQIVFDPSRLEELRQRHRFLRQLEKKYGMTITDLIAFKEVIGDKLKASASSEDTIAALLESQQKLNNELVNAAIALHNIRSKVQTVLCKAVEERLGDMGITDAKIRMQVQYREASNGLPSSEGFIVCDENGADQMWFEVSMNKGEPLKPLADIASGGEISRVMLAFKDASIPEHSIPVMVFDEIDSGISGRISDKVGGVMRKLSKKTQILAITHQPQIAAQADHHYVVQKAEEDGRVVSRIEKLNDRQHIEEVAALMSGSEITEANIHSAKELIEKSTRN